MTSANVIPQQLFITLSYKCNLRCSWCYASTSEYRGDMDKEYVERALDAASELGMKKVMLIGGEPTCSPLFFWTLEKIHKLGMKAAVVSNGIHFSQIDYCEKAAAAGLDSLNISLKGCSKSDYLTNTGSNALQLALSGYKYASKVIPNVMLSYVMRGSDDNEAPQLVELLQKNNIGFVYLQQLKPDGEPSQELDFQLIARTTESFYRQFQRTNIRAVFEYSIPLCLGNKNMISDLISEKRLITTCYLRSGRGLALDTNGDILPCNHLVNHPIEKIDTLTADSLLESHNSERSKQFRHIINHYPSPKCSQCDKWSICGGGCPLRWLSFSPERVFMDSNCFNL